MQSQDLKLQFVNSTIDYLKHLTTLSTGSIVIMATFWEKLSAKPAWKSAVGISLAGFMLSVLSSTVVYTFTLLFEFPGRPERPQWVAGIGGISFMLTWLGFLVGILGLCAFAIKNISRK